MTIKEGSCWVEGDNGSNSIDSNNYGPINVGLVVGTASHIVWPPERWQRLTPDVSRAGRKRSVEQIEGADSYKLRFPVKH